MKEERNELWIAYIRGNKNALGKLYTLYFPELVLFLNGMLGDTYLAEDVASQTIERLLNKPDPEKIDNFEAYLYTIARNICSDYFRTKGKRTSQKIRPITTHQTPEVEEAFAKEYIELNLKPGGQEIWNLLNQGFSLKKIARKIGKSVKTVYHTTTEIKKRLKNTA